MCKSVFHNWERIQERKKGGEERNFGIMTLTSMWEVFRINYEEPPTLSSGVCRFLTCRLDEIKWLMISFTLTNLS